MKIICTIITILITIFIISEYVISNTKFSQIDSCLNRGYCWDYTRNRCEKKDQGFCIKSEKDCVDRQGKWQENKKYCILK